MHSRCRLSSRCQRECSRRVNALAHAKPTMDVTNFPESPLISPWMPSISDPFAWSLLRPIKMARKVNIKPIPVMKRGQLPVKTDIEMGGAERFEREKLTCGALTVDCRLKKPGRLLYREGLAV